jgi:hypothetical protein
MGAGPRRARTIGGRIARRWCVPPAVMRGPGETVDGNGILGEVSGDLGLLLWGTARDVALWGGSPPGERGKLFRGRERGRAACRAGRNGSPSGDLRISGHHPRHANARCDLVAFTRAKRAVLTLAPQSTYPAVATAVADLWPVGEIPVRKLERAS